MTEANPSPGADLHTAADRIGNLLDPPPEDKAVEPAEAKADEPAAPEWGSPPDQGADGQAQEAEATPEQTPEFNSISEIAEALEMPLDDFLGKIKSKVKINGIEQEVTLAQLRNGYQMESDYRRKTSELAEQRKAFDAERERIVNEIGQQYNAANELAGVLEQQLMGEYQSIDWNSLRVSDPAEFAARKAEYNERFNQIQALKANVAHQLQAHQSEISQKHSEAFKAYLADESQKLASAIPEFADEAKSAVIKGQIKDYLKTHGYTDQDISQIYDHRQIMIIRDAMAYRELKAKGVEVKNKVVNAPKIQKPGVKAANAGDDTRYKELRARLRKTGRVDDAANLIKI